MHLRPRVHEKPRPGRQSPPNLQLAIRLSCTMMTMTTLDAPSQYGLHPTAANRHEHQQLQRSQQQPQQWLEPPDSAPAALPPCQAARGVLPPPPPQPPPPALLSPAASELLAGCIAGAANVVSGYPFDTVKVGTHGHKGAGTQAQRGTPIASLSWGK